MDSYMAIPGDARITNDNTFYWQNENYFNYNKQIGTDHNISAVLGISWSQITNNHSYMRNTHLLV